MKIRSIEVIPVDLPMTKTIKMAFETVAASQNAIVRLETDNGFLGWGDAPAAPTMTGETLESMVAAIRYLAPHLEGMDAEDIDAVMHCAGNYLYGNLAAKSTIEMALLDAVGRARGKPAYELLGGRKRRDRVPLLRQIASSSIEADIEEARRRRDEGFVVFKVKVGVADPLADAARTRAVCEALPEDRLLVCADANQGWTVEQAIAYARAVEDTKLAFLEQPVHGSDSDGLATVARASRLKLCVDEGLHGMDDLRRLHAAGAIGGGNLKIIKFGGMRPVYEAALLCDQYGLGVNISCKMAGCGILCAAVLQLAGAVPAMDWGMSLTVQYLAEDVLVKPLVLANGHAEVPDGPGLGIEVDEAKVRRFARRI